MAPRVAQQDGSLSTGPTILVGGIDRYTTHKIRNDRAFGDPRFETRLRECGKQCATRSRAAALVRMLMSSHAQPHPGVATQECDMPPTQQTTGGRTDAGGWRCRTACTVAHLRVQAGRMTSCEGPNVARKPSTCLLGHGNHRCCGLRLSKHTHTATPCMCKY